MRQVISKPSDKDLLMIIDELLNIQIHHKSFTVSYQIRTPFGYDEAIDIHEKVFPLNCLKRFFELNGSSKHMLTLRNPKHGYSEKRLS